MNSFKRSFLLQRSATILSVAIVTLAVIAAISGILIGFYYQPAAGDAYKSLARVNATIPFGWLVYSLHDIAGNGIIVLSLVQIVVMFLGRQFRSSWLTAWISGILLTLTTIGLGWTAMILGWNQLGYWRLKVELGIIESIPSIGGSVRNLLTGGSGVNTTTIVHFYTIHSYVLSVAAIALSIVHLTALLLQNREQKGVLLQRLEKSIATTAEKAQAEISSTTSTTSTT